MSLSVYLSIDLSICLYMHTHTGLCKDDVTDLLDS